MDLAKKILIVEDVSVMKHLVRRFLQEMGFKNLIEAEDGEKALEILKTEEVDLIISDWMMPNMDGIRFLKILRESDTLREIPFLMITANDEKEHIMEAARAGVTDYIIKPLAAQSFEKKIKELLG